MPERDYITEIMKHMADPQVGLVSNLIEGRRRKIDRFDTRKYSFELLYYGQRLFP